MYLNAQQILAAHDRKTVTVPTPEWGAGAEVLIGSMGALAASRLWDWMNGLAQPPAAAPASEPVEEEFITCDDPLPAEPPADEAEETEPAAPSLTLTQNTELMVRYCAASILDPATHEPAFTMADIERLGAKDKAPLQRIYEAALALNLETEVAAAAFSKNSAGTPGGSSGGA